MVELARPPLVCQAHLRPPRQEREQQAERHVGRVHHLGPPSRVFAVMSDTNSWALRVRRLPRAIADNQDYRGSENQVWLEGGQPAGLDSPRLWERRGGGGLLQGGCIVYQEVW